MVETLFFKSNQKFFEFQCDYGDTSLEIGKGVVALVLDMKEQLGLPHAVQIGANGVQRAYLLIAADDGGFVTFAETPSADGDPLMAGDLVIWVPHTYEPKLVTPKTHERFGWIGFIRAKIKPQTPLEIVCEYN